MSELPSLALFTVMIVGLLLVDLLVVSRKAHVVRMGEALTWSAVWIALALLFGGYVYLSRGSEAALQYYTGYVIEKALSVDNLFVFLVIFRAFATPPALLHKVLFWGVIGAIVMRALFIALGITLISLFHPIIYLFGLFLLFTGIKLFFEREKSFDVSQNRLLRFLRNHLPITEGYVGTRFFAQVNGRWMVTPLLITLIFVEAMDVIFAVDSVPAILAISTDPFIVFTSNIFAILGLRSLFFVLAGLMDKFRLLHYGLALILCFVGAKMLLEDLFHIPVAIALLVVIGILVVAVLASCLVKPQSKG